MRTTNIKIFNKTACDLVLIDYVLSKGVLSDKLLPPKYIHSTGAWQAEARGPLTGISGTVRYQIKNTLGIFEVSWINPVIGPNRYSVSIDEKFRVEQTGGIGYNALVAFTLYH